MEMEQIVQLPTPEELKKAYPLSETVKAIKAERDA